MEAMESKRPSSNSLNEDDSQASNLNLSGIEGNDVKTATSGVQKSSHHGNQRKWGVIGTCLALGLIISTSILFSGEQSNSNDNSNINSNTNANLYINPEVDSARALEAVRAVEAAAEVLEVGEEAEGTERALTTSATRSNIKLVIQTDNHPEDTSWTFESVRSGKIVASSPASNSAKAYAKNTKYEHVFKRIPGDLKLTIYDKIGDGICCNSGDGYYTVSIDGVEVIRGGGRFGKESSYVIKVGYDPSRNMSQRSKAWLKAHNSRRKQFFQSNKIPYAPLQWSMTLQADAQRWVNKLMQNCKLPPVGEGGIKEGENVAGKTGGGGSGNNKRLTPEDILKTWADDKMGKGFPANGSFTQVVWRASRYVGCASGFKKNADNTYCERHVCRYVTPGNCQMGAYDASTGENWKVPTLKTISPCGLQCPDEGCYNSDFDGLSVSSGSGTTSTKATSSSTRRTTTTTKPRRQTTRRTTTRATGNV